MGEESPPLDGKSCKEYRFKEGEEIEATLQSIWKRPMSTSVTKFRAVRR